MTRLLRLNCQCPKCGWVPSKQVTDEHVRALRSLDPEVRTDSLKCQNTRCRYIYWVTAAAYHTARAA